MRSSRIALKLTYRCPGHCRYCNARKQLWRLRGGQDMPEDLLNDYIKLLVETERHPFQEIHLTGGEISSLPNLTDIVERLQRTGLPLSATTAGWARKYGGWGELLRQIPFHKLYISLDHPNRKINDYIRGSGSWNRAVRAIEEALTSREQRGVPKSRWSRLSIVTIFITWRL